MATVAELRQGFKAVIDAMGTGLRVSAYLEPQPQPPAVCIAPQSWTYDVTFTEGAVDWRFAIWLYMAIGDWVRAQQAIDQYFGPTGTTSIVAAIRDNRTLGLAGVNARVLGASAYAQSVDTEGGKLLAARLDCAVSA